MNPNWLDFLGAAGARFDSEAFTNFGNLSDELRAAKEASIVVPLTHLGVLEWSGNDAGDYLQNQLTTNIRQFAPGKAQHSAWCTAKGRMLASFLLFRTDNGYRALLSSDLIEATRTGMQKYVMRSKVTISDLSESMRTIGLSGPDAEKALVAAQLPVPAEILATQAFPDGLVIRLEASRFIVVLARGSIATRWKALVNILRPAGISAWNWLDIQSGLPRVSSATKEAFVPQMADFDKIGGVSFNKGCYPGQEVVARTHYLGKVKRHLYRIHAGLALNDGAAIFPSEARDQLCGTVANSAPSPDGGFDALAVIQENFVGTNDLRIEGQGSADIPLERIIRVND